MAKTVITQRTVSSGKKKPAENTAKSTAAIKALVTLHQLNVEAALAEDFQEFVFLILNRTVSLCRYERAVLWDLRGRTPKLLGVSGQSDQNIHTELAQRWKRLVAALIDPETPTDLSRKAFEPDVAKDSAALGKMIPGLEAYWLPIFCFDELVAGLWIERWHSETWKEGETKLLESLVKGYGATWEKFNTQNTLKKWTRPLVGKKRTLVFLTALVAVLILWRVPLRVVAPCEVVPKDPFVVTAPLNGVISEVLVQPGQAVTKGEPLFEYDKQVPLEERNIARQQVEIIKSGLERARVQAFADPKARAEAALLQLKLKQEEIRLGLAEHNVQRLEVNAEKSGRVIVEAPEEWRGRPVVIGERVLMIVDPARTKLRIWLPDDDNIDFNRERPVLSLLNAMPDESYPATLDYVAHEVSTSPAGEPRIMAEALWTGSDATRFRMGLQGVAVLYGEKVSLGYLLLRKPLFWLRRNLGM